MRIAHDYSKKMVFCCDCDPAPAERSSRPQSNGFRFTEEEADLWLNDARNAGKRCQVLLENGSAITVCLQFDDMTSCMRLTYDQHCREVPYEHIKRLLSTDRDLRRVETKADIQSPEVVAVQLLSSTCIPMRFDTKTDKEIFKELVRKRQPSLD